MTAFLILALVLLALAGIGVASALGWTPDSRDPEFSAGHLLDPPRRS